MKRALIALAAVATIASATIAVPTSADARCRGCGVAVGVGAGLLGAAIIGGAIANSQPYYGPPPAYYAPQPVYRGPVYADDCRIVKQKVWVEGRGYRWRSRRSCWGRRR